MVVLSCEDFALRWPFGRLVCEEGCVVVVGEHAVFDLEGIRQIYIRCLGGVHVDLRRKGGVRCLQ